ncbi:MAG: phosphoribosylformylglycinamidine synthase subunit PurQ, partial [Clostridia bacterium]|nr:phosphoribosylformylglycinamidine synthase subunit PurQ [Clostridia bacterium]
TLVSFAVTTEDIDNIVSPEFKKADRKVVILRPDYDENGLPITKSLLSVYDKVYELVTSGKCVAAYTPTFGGIAEAVMKMTFGNGIGFAFNENADIKDIFGYNYGSFILELIEDIDVGETLGVTLSENVIIYRDKAVDLDSLQKVYEEKLEPVYSCNIEQGKGKIAAFSCEEKSTAAPLIKVSKPKVLIPVFPGTNCEFDTAKAMARAGADPEIIVIKNLTAQGITESVEYFAKQLKEAQMVFIPGGFSGGDEPDGSGKFITAFFRNGAVKEQVNELLKNRDGLMCGVCNGFQAIIKLGLVPYGEIIDTDENCPTLTFNTIGRHQSRIVRTRIASTKSPWLSACEVGDIYDVPISHGEGKFWASDDVIANLAKNGQIATQYVDLEGNPTSDIRFNPNDSAAAIEGILSPDGRVFGKMGHSERWCDGLYKNVPGNYDMKMFESAVNYFKL